MKTCSKCSMNKLASEFRPFARSRDGLAAWCVDCHRAASKAHYEANKAARNAAATRWSEVNKEKVRQSSARYRMTNKAALYMANREWVAANRDARRAIDARRKAAKKRAVPGWVDLAAIRQVYAEARRIESITGQRMHVDHIVPLQSHLVCGLHWHGNLQILPGSENESKRNFWWPDMVCIEQAAKQGQLFEAERPQPQQMDLAA